MNLTNESFVLVGGLPRSGGSLLPFFLDGSPGIMSLPFELHVSNSLGVNAGDEQRWSRLSEQRCPV